MANPEHLAILKQGMEVWNQWRDENPEIKLDLSRADLKEFDLSGFDLHRANLHRADLRRAKLRVVELSHSDLCGAVLTGANLTRSNLSESILSGADLSESYLLEVDLSRADLSEARLSLVDLRKANLFEAELSKVNLSRADLSGANLTGANLHQARLAYTLFADVDLSDVQGLTDIQHRAPSSIGIDTLYRSGGNIPEVFLRGCGVPDTMITFAKSLVGKPIDFYSCFISYSSADEAFAKMLYDTLQGAGIRCWYAPDQILPGERIDSAIDHGIRYWDKVVFCASKSSLTEKWWVDFEVDKAFKKERDLQRERGEKVDVIIPLNLDGYLFSPEYDLDPKRSIFEMTNAADFVGWKNDLDKYNREVQKLIRALRTDGGKEDPPESKL